MKLAWSIAPHAGEVPYRSQYAGTTVLNDSGATVAAPYGMFSMGNQLGNGQLFDKPTAILNSTSLGRVFAEPEIGIADGYYSALFNQRDDPSGLSYGDIDPALWTALRAVTSWPAHDLFPELLLKVTVCRFRLAGVGGAKLDTATLHIRRRSNVIKRSKLFGTKTRVTFCLPKDAPAGTVSVVGCFNEWEPGRHELVPRKDGTRTVSVKLEPGRYRFRYLATGGVWLDDEHADRVDHEGSEIIL